MDDQQGDICRVCRCEAQSDRPLFYPCICTGSIKYIHQDCLVQWMRYSHKEYCELCGHRFSFQPIYSPDMPRVLPLRDVASGLLSAVVKATKSWFHYTLVGLAWFGVVPLSAYRTYRYLFRASTFDMILSLPFDVFSTDNIASDAFRGCFVVTCTLLSFIGLVWLREQILHGGGPDWLERDDAPAVVNDAEEQADVNVENEEPPNVQVNNEQNIGDDDNNNGGAPRDVPMNNAVPAIVNPAEEEGEMPYEFGPQPAARAAPNNINNNNNNNNNNINNNLNNNNNNNNINNLNNNNNNINIAAGAGGGDGVGAQNVNDAAAAENDNDNDNDEQNWNPMEWDRAAEELTWERLLGLDGSLVFLEHVFWIISLNTMFIFTFAFCPYCIGNFILNLLDLITPEKPLLHFHGLVTTLFGYCCIGMTLVILHFFARVFRMRRVRWLIGLCYIVVKVSLLSVIEIGVLPLVCGCWLDICSLPLFDASIKDRKVSFRAAPGTSLFVHWMFGMVFVYYFAAFVSLLREVLRPGVLWFLRNLNDPDFSPIQEMIHVPIVRHIRRLTASAIIFGSVVLLMLWLPIRILQTLWPSFLPFTLSGDSEVNELSLQLLLLQIILPGFFEQSHTRIWLKGLLRIWCICVSWVLGIRSYLLGSDEQEANNEFLANAAAQQGQQNGQNEPPVQREAEQPNQQNAQGQQDDAPDGVARPLLVPPAAPAPAPAPAPQNQAPQMLPLQAERNLGAAHQALLQRDVPIGYQPYEKTTLFPLRLFGLIFFMCVSLVIASLVTLTLPIWLGRQVMALWSVGSMITQPVAQNANVAQRPHELYSAAMGTYLCWIISRAIAIAVNLLPQGRDAVLNKVKQWLRIGISYALPVLIFILMLGVIPLLFGLLLELIVVIPLRVPFYQTPVHFLWQDWALGVLYTKIAIALTLMGPDWHLKRAIERAYRDGLRDMDLKFLINDLAMPVIAFFGLSLAIPYVLANSIVTLFVADPVTCLEISRTIYPVFFIVVVVMAYVGFEINQFKKLYVAIKVDKYLVGQRLVNYENRKRKLEASEEVAGIISDDEKARLQVEQAVVHDHDEEFVGDMILVAERRAIQVQRDGLVHDLLRDEVL